MTQRKYIGLIFLLGALVSLILLAGSLSNLQLQPGAPFPGGGNSDRAVQPIQALPVVGSYSFSIMRGVFALIFLITAIFVLARIATLANIMVILRSVFVLGLLLIILSLMPSFSPGQPNDFPSETPEITNLPAYDYQVTSLGQPPQALIVLVIIAVVLGVGLLTIKILNQWLKKTRIEDALLQEAEQAVIAINNGMDLSNVIVHCYLQMTRALREEQGIERNNDMTVREFEDLLEYKGYPTVPVHQLTGLFEKVRYGKQQMINSDEKEAIRSLNEIIDFCRRKKG